MILRMALTVLMVFVSVSTASAEVLKFKSGKTLEGKVVEETDTYIKLDTGIGIPLTYYKDELVDAPAAAGAEKNLASETTETKLSDDEKINDILQKTVQTYRDLQGFQCQGEAVFDLQTQQTSLKKLESFNS